MSEQVLSTVSLVDKLPAIPLRGGRAQGWIRLASVLLVALILVGVIVIGVAYSSQAAPLAPPGVDVTITAIPTANRTEPQYQILPGKKVTYTVTVRNTRSDGNADDGILTNTLPSQTEFVSATTGYNLLPDNVLTWQIGTLAYNETFVVTIIASLPETGTVMHDYLLDEARAELWNVDGSVSGIRTAYHYAQNASLIKPNTSSVIDTYNSAQEAVAGELVTITVFFTIPQGTIVYSATPRVLLADGLWPDSTEPVTVNSFITTTQRRYPVGPLDRLATVDSYQLEFAQIEAITDTDSGPRVLSYTIYAHARQYRFLDQSLINNNQELRVHPVLRWCAQPGCLVDYNDTSVHVVHSSENRPQDLRPNVIFARPDVVPQAATATSVAYLDSAGVGEGGGQVRLTIVNRNQGGVTAYDDMVFTATLGSGLTYNASNGGTQAGDQVVWTVPMTLEPNATWDAVVTATLPSPFVVGTQFDYTGTIRYETLPGQVPDEGVYVSSDVPYSFMPGLRHTKTSVPAPGTSSSSYVRMGERVTYTVTLIQGANTSVPGPYYTDTLPVGFHLTGTVQVDGATVTQIATAAGPLEAGTTWVKEDIAWYMDDLPESASAQAITATYVVENTGLDFYGTNVWARNANDFKPNKNSINSAQLYWTPFAGEPPVSLAPASAVVGNNGVQVVQPYLGDNFTTSRLDTGDREVGQLVQFRTAFRNTGRVIAHDVRVCDQLPTGLTLDTGIPPVFTPATTAGCSPQIVQSPVQGDNLVCWTIDMVCVANNDNTLEYYAVIGETAIPGTPLANTTFVDDYTSLPGDVSIERHYGPIPAALPAPAACGTPGCLVVLGLAASKTAQQDNVLPGDLITYTLAYTDTSGPLNYTGLVITDTYDENLIFVNSSLTPDSHVANRMVWNLGDVPVSGGGQIVLTMQINPVVPGTVMAVTNTMMWDSVQTVPLEWPLRTPVGVANPHVQLTGPDTTYASDTITYTVVYSNDGSGTQPVTLTLDYGNYLTYVDSDPLLPVTGTVNVFVDSTLPNTGEPHTLIIHLSVNAPLPYSLAELYSDVTISSAGAPSQADDVTVTLKRPVFFFQKQGPSVPSSAGQSMKYTIRITNTGDYTATNLILTDTWGANTSYDPGNTPAGWTNYGVYATYVITQLGIGQSLLDILPTDLFFYVSVDATATFYTNTVDLATDQTTAQRAKVKVWQESIATTKSADPDPAFPGRVLTYTIYYTNTGGAETHAYLTDTLPVGFVYQGQTVPGLEAGCLDPGWQFQGLTGQDAVWTCASLSAGAQGQLQIWGEVLTQTEGTVLENVTKTSGDLFPLREIEEPLRTRSARPWLEVVKSADMRPVATGDLITYTLVHSNNGTDPAHNMTIVDPLPAGAAFVGCEPALLCNESGGVVTWNLGTVPTDTVDSVMLVVEATGTGGQTIVNAGYTIQADRLSTSDTYNGPPVFIDILDPHLTLTKEATPTVVTAVNAPISYTILYANDGGGTVHSVVITDVLSSFTSFASASLNCGHSGETVGGVVTCTIGTLEQGQSGVVEIYVESVTTQSGAEITNQAEAYGVSHAQGLDVPAVSNETLVYYFPAGECIPIINASFTRMPAEPKVGEVITFTGQVDWGTDPVYNWDFGDGETGSGQVVTHTYYVSDTYTVVMDVDNTCTLPGVGVYSDTLAVSGEPVIAPDPTVLTETLVTGTSTQTLIIGNDGDVNLEWVLAENPAVDWLDEALTSGTVAPGGSDSVEVTFDATGLAAGIYATTLRISSAPGSSVAAPVDVPVTLTVQAVLEPNIEVTPSALAMTLTVGSQDTADLTIANDGGADLTWNLAESPAADWLNQDSTSGVVVPGGSATVQVTFNATGLTPGDHTTTLQISSNDPDQNQVDVPVTLTVQAIPEPDIVVTPLSLTVTLEPGDTVTEMLVITNTGNADLTWSVEITPTVGWLTAAPTSGVATVMLPGSSVVVRFDATGLAAGTYETTLVISSNDPDQPRIEVPVTLVVPKTDFYIYLPIVARNL